MKLRVVSSPFSHIEKGMVGETDLTPDAFKAKNGGSVIAVQFKQVLNPTGNRQRYDPVVAMLKKELEPAPDNEPSNV